MKAKNVITIIVSLMLLCSIAVSFASCALKAGAVDLMEGIEASNTGATSSVSADDAAKATDFAVRLFKAESDDGKENNVLISPLSVLAALSMTANGADGSTKDQMEKVLGMSTGELNKFFYAYMQALPDTEKSKLSLANSIWFTSDEIFTVNRDFLQTNADYYGADAYKAPFDDSTLEDINNWVKRKTDGMIPEILDRIPSEAVMYLINALAFKAEWEELYEENSIREGDFTKSDGTKQKVDFMRSTENRYLEDESAKGFIKYYSGQRYAFAALLPNEGIRVEDYISSLDGQKLYELLSAPEQATVQASIPRFEAEYSTEMSATLKSMGMTYAFEKLTADFKKLGSTTEKRYLYISRILHKAFISVDEKGTKAGAATVVEIVADTGAYVETKEVYLDRPFVYMLIDTQTNIPFFLGVMTDVNE